MPFIAAVKTATVVAAKTVAGVAVVGGVAAGGLYAAKEPVTKFSCTQIAGHSEIDADHCTKAVAVKLLNPAMCNSITGDAFKVEINGEKVLLENPPKMECLTAIAAATNNPSLCDQVEGFLIANTKIDCLYRVAAANGNPAACGGIGSDSQSRAGSDMSKAGCIALAARQVTAATTPDPGIPACPAGAVRKGSGTDAPCACEIKPTGIIYSLTGLGRSSWHTLRPGEECGWWTGFGGVGENLGKDKRACYNGGGTNWEPSEATCSCPLGAHWNAEKNTCMCSNNGAQLKQGEACTEM